MSTLASLPTCAQVSQGGPWPAPALRLRALADLAAIATDMHGRQREPHEIGHALARQSALWRQRGASLPPDAALTVIRQLPGLCTYDPLEDWQRRWANVDPDSLAEGIDADGNTETREWTRRALTLANWLRARAGTASAEAAVRAVERNTCDYLEGVEE